MEGFSAGYLSPAPLLRVSITLSRLKLPGVWLATGHEGLGITTSLGTAELVAHGLCGAATPLDPLPFLPARFSRSAFAAAEVPAHG